MHPHDTSSVTVMEEESEKTYDYHPLDEFWTQHRTTLISYEMQFVNNLKPEVEEGEGRQAKAKKKNIEYEGGFLFPGKAGDKEENISVTILASKYNSLRELFSEAAPLKETVKLRQFVRIMLQLKHSSIIRQFMEIYEVIIREIKQVNFQSLREEAGRFAIVEDIMQKVTSFLQQCPYLFGHFGMYLKDNFRETTKLFKVTAYCFLAERHHFNINEFYCEAFDFQEPEGRVPKKKKKMMDEQSDPES